VAISEKKAHRWRKASDILTSTIRVEREWMDKIRKKIKRIRKGTGKSKKSKRWGSEWIRGKGGKGMPQPHTGQTVGERGSGGQLTDPGSAAK